MEKWLALICSLLILSVALSLYGNFTRHSYVDGQFCQQDTAMVQFLTDGLKTIKKTDIKVKDIPRYEQARANELNFIDKIAKGSPCTITYTIPPDPLASP